MQSACTSEEHASKLVKFVAANQGDINNTALGANILPENVMGAYVSGKNGKAGDPARKACLVMKRKKRHVKRWGNCLPTLRKRTEKVATVDVGNRIVRIKQ